MNWETIIVALIAALGPLIGTILTLRQQQHFIQAKSQVFQPSPHPIIWKYPLGKDNCRSSKHLEKISPSLEL